MNVVLEPYLTGGLLYYMVSWFVNTESLRTLPYWRAVVQNVKMVVGFFKS